MTYNCLCNENFKHWKKIFFFWGYFSKAPQTDIYINDNQRYSDNKYLNKRYNITGLSGTLNFNKSTKNKKCDEQEVTLPGL